MAEPGHSPEGEHRIAQVDENRATEHEVESAEALGGRLVDGQPDARDRAAEHLVGEPEGASPRAVLGRTQARRPVEL